MCPCRQPSGKIPPCRQCALHVGCALRAAWNCCVVRFLVFVLVVGVMLVIAGCKSATVPTKRPPVNSAPVIAGQLGKDATIIEEAAKIDAIAPEAKPHTDAQRAAIAANPAQDVAKLVAEFEKRENEAAKETAAIIAGLRAEIEAANSLVDRVIRIGGYALAAILGAAAAASLFLAAQVPWLGPRISAALGAASVSIFAMVWAYEWTKQHPWITAITGACILVAAALAYANHLHDRSPKTDS
jgi:hypothetical protein